MYAIVETGGKQYRVSEGDVITVERLDAEVGTKVELDRVLLLGEGEDLKVGAPYIDGAAVIAEVVEHGKAKKVIIFKYKYKKDYRKKQGHRQPYTMLRIEDLNGKATAKAEAPAEEAAKAKVSASMKKDELIAYAEEHGIEVDAKATKAAILEAIEAAEK